jgi:hypothetical protein
MSFQEFLGHGAVKIAFSVFLYSSPRPGDLENPEKIDF